VDVRQLLRLLATTLRHGDPDVDFEPSYAERDHSE
jgi:hypothetical protein